MELELAICSFHYLKFITSNKLNYYYYRSIPLTFLLISCVLDSVMLNQCLVKTLSTIVSLHISSCLWWVFMDIWLWYLMNVLSCLLQTLRTEGPLALYKGFFPSYLRLGPWNIIVSYSHAQCMNKGTFVSKSAWCYPSPPPTLHPSLYTPPPKSCLVMQYIYP